MASSWNKAAQQAESTVSDVAAKGSSLWQTVVDGAAEALASGKEAIVDVADDVYDALPEQEDVVEGVTSVASAVGDVAQQVGEAASGAVSAVNETFNEAGENLLESGTSEFRFFLRNYFNPGSTVTEDKLNDTDMEVLRSAVRKAKEAGRTGVDYPDFKSSQGTILKGNMLEGLFNPELRMARTTGGFKFEEDEDGNTIIRNTYNFNSGPKREAYLEAVKEGETMESLELLLESATNPVELASILAYAKQEMRREAGEPAETEMVINLGKL